MILKLPFYVSFLTFVFLKNIYQKIRKKFRQFDIFEPRVSMTNQGNFLNELNIPDAKSLLYPIAICG